MTHSRRLRVKTIIIIRVEKIALIRMSLIGKHSKCQLQSGPASLPRLSHYFPYVLSLPLYFAQSTTKDRDETLSLVELIEFR